MKIFISWSGDLSQSVALILRQWLQNVIQVVDPYVSSEDIEKGSRWFSDIDKKLDESEYGIVCLTRENKNKPWILFEAGAISRSIERSRVTPFLIDFSPADLDGPLAQFQATTPSEADMLRLVKSIGHQLNDSRFNDSLLERAFFKWWPDLQQQISEVMKSVDENESRKTVRPDRDILEELLKTTRALAQAMLTNASPSEPQKTRDSPGSDIEKIRLELERRRKMFLVVALEEAQLVEIDEDELYIDYAPDTEYLGAVLAKPENLEILKEACKKVLGRDLSVRIGNESVRAKWRLKKLAKKDPVVQKMLQTFRGEIVDVREVKPDAVEDPGKTRSKH